MMQILGVGPTVCIV